MFLFDRVAQAGAKYLRESMDRHKELRMRRLPDSIRLQPAARDNEMDMRMIFALPGPGVEHGGHSGNAADPFGVGAQIKQCRRGDIGFHSMPRTSSK